ncbi:5-formyltetrahydrofolate cyclo-ligase [Francisella halioticida]|uniref:5-formyltetrahydrofolate cyclo-ligase n=1 Tax=Francisella halioticida TaxID=549298 RepID=A0ABM6LZ60_9GAMM|nr:YecA family protein [Francisella halioticida]ASG67862.1 5-formyltetrahydrofolate cyclo-ligase [Francisella halioticida]BCD90657.1 5-formyltetrahydrofolate cyclo-ligase [Francisella halioticida]
MKNEKPNFEDVKEALKVMQALSSASEAHGLLCALFSFGAEVKFTAWSDSLMTKTIEEGDLVSASALKTMKKLYDYTKSQFDEKGLSFDLFIPEDNELLSYRAEALTYWIKGFLSGVGLFGLDFENSKAKEVKEAIHDLMQISYMDYDSLEQDESCEDDFMELLEYTKVAVLLIDSEKV